MKTYEVTITDKYGIEDCMIVTVDAHCSGCAVEAALDEFNVMEESRVPPGKVVEYAEVEDIESVRMVA